MKTIVLKVSFLISLGFLVDTQAFSQNLADGQSYTVGGWINKSTTVRTR